MFQSFDATTSPGDGPTRLARLRAAMAAAGLDGFVVPRGDAHQGETVPARDERLAWLTGFTGSAGLCIALATRAAVFVDGRYTLQARAQVDGGAFEIVAVAETTPETWLAEALPSGSVLGLDAMLHTAAELEKFTGAAVKAGATTRLVETNVVDSVWPDQPAPPLGAIEPHPEALAGETAQAKRTRIAAAVAAEGAAAAVLTLPPSIAWLLNIRGADVARLPAPLGFAILGADGGVELFADPRKLDETARAHLGNTVSVAPPDAFGAGLDRLAGCKVLVDRDSAPVWVVQRLEAAGATVAFARDPVVLPKAVKNAAELAGARAAHVRDAAAVVRFLHWLATEAPKGTLSEIDVVTKLEALRRAAPEMRDIPFETICGAGPHGAIVHYRVSHTTNRPVRPGELLLIDSGAQYPDGTTDITRTVAIGAPDPEARRLFTLVLKGMIAISRALFPARTTGRDLDALARRALWEAGHDYDHGTGHGVGSYLGVHEGPQGISKRSAEPLLPGMILSNEPGCYIEGRFGIRIENLLVVTAPQVVPGGGRPMMGFETLTLAPIDRTLIDTHLLDPADFDWLDAYHARVLAEVAPLVEPAVATWLAEVCAPLR